MDWILCFYCAWHCLFIGCIRRSRDWSEACQFIGLRGNKGGEFFAHSFFIQLSSDKRLFDKVREKG